jgi:polar amino acid transport system permease protein
VILFEYAGSIAQGIGYTLAVYVGASLIALSIGVLVGLFLARSKAPVRIVLRVYVEFFRGTSAIVQLFWIFYVLPIFGLSLPPVAAAIVGLGLCFGAYTAEAIRSCILQIPKGQFEAAMALGMSGGKVFRLVILPQLVQLSLPFLENIAILLLKATAGASLITVPELTFTGYVMNTATYKTFTIFMLLLVIYYVMASVVTLCTGRIRKRFDRWAKPQRA